MNIGVIGGGVSGIRAALTLARAGARVALLEKNQHLGGRVFSFATPDFGEVDIGQHIWLRCCTALEQLLHDLAVPEDWVFRQDRVGMTYRWPDGHVWSLSMGRLPGGLAVLPVLYGARLGLLEKWRFLCGAVRAALYSERSLAALDTISIAAWLRAQGQPLAVVQLFWEPFIVGVCNGRLDEVSARYALGAMRESLLKSPEAAAICLLRRPLSDVFDRQAAKVLRAAGVEVCTGANVIEVGPGTPVVVRSSTQAPREFDRVILALPLKRMRAFLPGAALPEPPKEGAIAGLLLRFAAPVMDELVFTGVGSPAQTVFNKSAVWGRQEVDGSQVIEIVISAAEREVKLGVERLAAELLPALAKLLPRVATTPLLAKRMLVHATATFRVTPGTDGRRLNVTRPDVPNVAFAGDFGATGLASTMESAVRAGQTAAEEVLHSR
jgi:squalene-associated FAD-dependent desaturase